MAVGTAVYPPGAVVSLLFLSLFLWAFVGGFHPPHTTTNHHSSFSISRLRKWSLGNGLMEEGQDHKGNVNRIALGQEEQGTLPNGNQVDDSYDFFQAHVRQLNQRQKEGGTNEANCIRIVPKEPLGDTGNEHDSFHNDDDDDKKEVQVNSIVFLARRIHGAENEYPIMAIVDSSDRVDLDHLARRESERTRTRVSLRLAPSERLHDLCGYRPGCVPPCGHDLPTHMDQKLLRNGETTHRWLVGGAGRTDRRSLIPLPLLLSLDSVHVGDITCRSNGIATNDNMSTTTPSCQGDIREAGKSNPEKPTFPVVPEMKSFLTVSPPPTAENTEPRTTTADFEFEGRIKSVRKLARRLVFADLAPVSYIPSSMTGLNNEEQEEGEEGPAPSSDSGNDRNDPYHRKRLLWRSPVDGNSMGVQLIVGKTVCDALHEEGPAALRRIKLGRRIRGRGRITGLLAGIDHSSSSVWKRVTTVANENWTEKRILDVTVSAFEILDQEGNAMGTNGDLTSRRGKLPLPFLRPLREKADQGPQPSLLPSETHDAAPSLPTLTLTDLNYGEMTQSVTIVDNAKSLRFFQQSLYTMMAGAEESCNGDGDVDFLSKLQALTAIPTEKNETETGNETATTNRAEGTDKWSTTGSRRLHLVGMDCEWKPEFLHQMDTQDDNQQPQQPVAVCQISLHSLGRVFLLDLQSLLRPHLLPTESMTETESAVSSTLRILFTSREIIKVGFRISGDLQRLFLSFPHLPAFQTAHAVVDVAPETRRILSFLSSKPRCKEGFGNQGLMVGLGSDPSSIRPKFHTRSLASLTEYVLGFHLCKRQQISNWSKRPLTAAQIHYAALDAAVTPVLLERAWQTEARFRRDKNWEAKTWRFWMLTSDDMVVPRKLNAQRVGGSNRFVVPQCWNDGEMPPSPPTFPKKSGKNQGRYADGRGSVWVPAKTLWLVAHDNNNHALQSKTENRGGETEGNSGSFVGPKTLKDWVGKRMGKSKEQCLEFLLSADLQTYREGPSTTLPPEVRLYFPHRRGYVIFQNGAVLFVNTRLKGQRYPNRWLDHGRTLTWYLREREWCGGTSELASKLLASTTTTSDPTVILLVRLGSSKAPFLCCGRCRISLPTPIPAASPFPREEEEENKDGQTVDDPQDCDKDEDSEREGWELVELHVHLLDWDKLQESIDFRNLTGTPEKLS